MKKLLFPLAALPMIAAVSFIPSNPVSANVPSMQQGNQCNGSPLCGDDGMVDVNPTPAPSPNAGIISATGQGGPTLQIAPQPVTIVPNPAAVPSNVAIISAQGPDGSLQITPPVPVLGPNFPPQVLVVTATSPGEPIRSNITARVIQDPYVGHIPTKEWCSRPESDCFDATRGKFWHGEAR